MKQWKKSLMVLCVSVMMLVSIFAVPVSAEAEVAVSEDYDWKRFEGQGITLDIYNWGEYISDGTDGESLDVNAAFTELTGIEINYTTYDTNETMYSKLKSGGANYDIIIPSDYMVGKLANEDMLASLDFANIPNYSYIGEEYLNMDYDPNNEYSVPYTWGFVGIVYNTTMVDEEVSSWDVLWDEKYEGDVLMFDNSRDAFAIALKKLGLSLNPSSQEDIDAATEELMAQKGVVQAYVMDQIFDKMGGGEAAFAPYYAGDAITMMADNPDLAFAIPEEGTNYFVDAMCIPADSANKEAAEMYINFMCEPEVAMENSMYIGYSTANTAAAELMPDEVRNNPIAYPSAEQLANMETFTVLPDELNAAMDKAWSDMRGGNEAGAGWVIPVAVAAAVVLVIAVAVMRTRKKKRDNY